MRTIVADLDSEASDFRAASESFAPIRTHFRVTLSADRQEAVRLDDIDQAIRCRDIRIFAVIWGLRYSLASA